jgi:hypothetical protein
MNNLRIISFMIGIIGALLLIIKEFVTWEEKDKETSKNLGKAGAIICIISIILSAISYYEEFFSIFKIK